MIDSKDLISVGRVTHTHGLNGELTVHIDDPVFDDVKRCPYLVCEVDGIFVPFFIAHKRWQNNASLLLTFEDVANEKKAQFFVGKELWFDRRCFTAQEAKEYDSQQPEAMPPLVGYTLIDEKAGVLGPVTALDTQTANPLFFVDYQGEELMVPAADDLILAIDDDRKEILMRLPEGLLNLDDAEMITE